MPAVMAIAIAPQKATRRVALPTGAPPVFAPITPNIVRNNNDAADTSTIIRGPNGDSQTVSSGNDAPAEKVVAEVIAAYTGRAVVMWVMLSSTRACALIAFFAVSCAATSSAVALSSPRLW